MNSSPQGGTSSDFLLPHIKTPRGPGNLSSPAGLRRYRREFTPLSAPRPGGIRNHLCLSLRVGSAVPQGATHRFQPLLFFLRMCVTTPPNPVNYGDTTACLLTS